MEDFNSFTKHYEETTVESIKINDVIYQLEHKPANVHPSKEDKMFVIEQWEKPKGEGNMYLNEALSLTQIDSLKDENNKTFALSSYSFCGGKNRDIMGDGKISLVLVRDDYRKRNNIGYSLVKRAIDNIIINSEKDKYFTPPVIIKAEADTKEGSGLMKKMQVEYGGKVKFEIEERYLENDDENTLDL